MSLTTDGNAGIATGRGSGRATLRLRRLLGLHAAILCLDGLVLCFLGGLHVLRIDIGKTIEGVFLLGITEDVLSESLQLLLDTLLLGRELRGVTIAEL